MLSAFGRTAPRLSEYAGVHVIATEATCSRLITALRDQSVVVERGPAGCVGEARRGVLRSAVAQGFGAFFYCDFDRWLFWAERFPEELAKLPERVAARRPRHWYACLGRTARALASHPQVQRVAEGATNRALSLAIGRRIDATAGACWLSAEGAAIVLQESVEATNATDLEWPALIHRAAPQRLGALRCDGLAFETASFYGDEIAGAGSERAWIEGRYERTEVWSARLRLASESVAALQRVLR